MNMALRRQVQKAHRWTGLTVGLLVLMLALTGLGLVFRHQLDPLLEPRLHQAGSCSAALPLDTLTDGARAAHPGAAIDQVRLAAREPVLVRFADRSVAYVDACDGTVLLQRPRWSGVTNTFEQVHRWRFLESGETADLITGSVALAALTLLVIPGFILWWPRTRQGWRRAFKPPTRLQGPAFELGLHRWVGGCVGLVLLVVTLSALPMAFEWPRQLLFAATGSAPAPAPARPLSRQPVPGVARLPMDGHMQRARALLPDAPLLVLAYPRRERDPVKVAVLARDAPHPEAWSTLYMDAYSGEVLAFLPYARASLASRLVGWATALHKGDVGGWFGQCVLFTGVLGVPVLAFTGMRTWWRRSRSSRHGPTSPQLLPLRIRRIGVETPEIKLIELVSTHGGALPAFTPGAHIDVHVGLGLVRPYCLCGDPADRTRYLIAVRRARQSRGASEVIHDRWSEGDSVAAEAPRNDFPLQPRAGHHLLLAEGIGIAPMLSMARHLLSTGASFELQHFTRTAADAAFENELSAPELRGRFRRHLGLADPARLLQALLSKRPGDAHLYLCGSRQFTVLGEACARPVWPAAAVHVKPLSEELAAPAGGVLLAGVQPLRGPA